MIIDYLKLRYYCNNVSQYTVFDIHNNFTYPDNNAVMAKRRVSKYEKCFH